MSEILALHKLESDSLEEWQRHFIAQTQQSGQSQMPEYQHNYTAGLQGWLSNTYLQLEAMMGTEYSTHVKTYLELKPLSMSNMRSFEDGFLKYLGGIEHPYYDIGRADLAIHQSYYAVDSSPFPYEAMTALQPDEQLQLRFMLAPSVIGITSTLPLVRIWNAYKEGSLDLARQVVSEQSDELLTFLIVRREFRPEIIALSESAQLLFQGLKSQQTLEQLPEQAHEVIPRWIQEGIIVGFR